MLCLCHLWHPRPMCFWRWLWIYLCCYYQVPQELGNTPVYLLRSISTFDHLNRTWGHAHLEIYHLQHWTEGRTWLECPLTCHLTKSDTPVFGRLIKYLIAIQLDRYRPHATWSDRYICQKRRCITQLTHEVCSVVVHTNQTSPTTTRWWT